MIKKKIPLILLMILIIPLMLNGAFAVDDHYSERFELEINSSLIDDDLTKFITFVNLTKYSNFNFSEAQADGDDVHFTNEFENVTYDFDIVEWNQGSEIGNYFVEIPTVSSTTNTKFRVLWDNASASSMEDEAGTWENFFSVLHNEEDTTSDRADASGSNDWAVSSGSVPNTGGIVSDGDDVDGDVMNSTDNFDGYSEGTIFYWVKSSSTNKWIMSSRDSGTGGFIIFGDGSGGQDFRWYATDNGDISPVTGGLDGNWHRMAFTANGTANGFIDGEINQTGDAHSGSTTGSQSVAIGRSEGAGGEIVAEFDEVWISTEGKSAAWIKADYYSTSGSDLLLSEKSIIEINITSPTNTTYFDYPDLNFTVTDGIESNFTVRAYMDGTMFYSNSTYFNNTQYSNITATFTEGQHNFTVWANGTSTGSQTVFFTIDRTNPETFIFNYTFFNGFRSNQTEEFYYRATDNIDSNMTCNLSAGSNSWTSEYLSNNTNYTKSYNFTSPINWINITCEDNVGNNHTTTINYSVEYGNSTIFDEETRELFNLTNHNVTLFVILEDRAYSILNASSNYNYYTVNGSISLIRAIVDNSYYRSVFHDDDGMTEIYVYDQSDYPSSQIDISIDTPYTGYIRVTRLYSGGELIIHEQYPVGSDQEATLYLMNNRPYNLYVYPSGVKNRILEIVPTGADTISLTIPDVTLDIINVHDGYVQFSAIQSVGNVYNLQAIVSLTGEYTVDFYNENNTAISSVTASGNSVTYLQVNTTTNGSFYEVIVTQDTNRFNRFLSIPGAISVSSFDYGSFGTSGTYNMDMTIIAMIGSFAILLLFGFIDTYSLGFVIAGVFSIIMNAFFQAHSITYWWGWTLFILAILLFIARSGKWR